MIEKYKLAINGESVGEISMGLSGLEIKLFELRHDVKLLGTKTTTGYEGFSQYRETTYMFTRITQ